MSDDYIVHFGVKGMKWGKRKSPESELASIRRQQSRINVDRLEDGQSVKAYYVHKSRTKDALKNPDFSYSKLSKSEKAAYSKEVSKKAYADLAAKTVFDLAFGVAIGKIGGQYLFNLNAKNSNMAAGIIAGAATINRVGQISSLSLADKHERLWRRADELEQEIKAGKHG